MSEGAIAAIVLGATLVVLTIFIIALVSQQKKTKRETQRTITDQALLRLIANQPDGLLSKQMLVDETGMTKTEASIRLTALHTASIVKASYTSSFKYYYELRKPLIEREVPPLSPEPFLTVNDILNLFQAYEYKLDFQDLIVATGLPLDVIKREMKYFEKEKVVRSLYTTNSSGTMTIRRFFLAEPYRSNPTAFLNREKELNAKVKEILREDLLI